MLKNFKNYLVILLGFIVVIQTAVATVTLLKMNKLEEAVANANESETVASQQPEQTEMIKSPVPVEQDGAPTIGPDDAVVKIVEFTDFECSFCKEVQPTLKELLKKYEGKVQFTVRSYPISSIHAGAVDAAMAGYCANEQGEFWEMHDLMFEKANNGGSLKRDLLKSIASELGIQQTQFNACLDSKKYIDRVQKDFEDGTKYSVSGTPTFFINETIVTGSQPLDVFSKVIDAELQKQ